MKYVCIGNSKAHASIQTNIHMYMCMWKGKIV